MCTVYVTCGILTILYIATLIRIMVSTKMHLVEAMIVLLIISQLAFTAKENMEYWLICQAHAKNPTGEEIKLAKVSNDL